MIAVRRPAGHALGLILVAGVAGLVGLAIVLPSVSDIRLAPLGPILSFTTELGNAATAAVLFATWRNLPAHRSTFVLALTAAASAVLMLLTMLVSRLLPDAPPMVAGAPGQFGVWLTVLWHVTAGIGALCYVALRRSDDRDPPPRRFVVTASVMAAIVLGVCLVLAGIGARWLPLVAEPVLRGVDSSGLGPLVALFLIAAIVATCRIRSPNMIDRALTLSLIALVFDMLLVPLTQRFSDAFYLSRTLLLLGGGYVFVAVVRTLIRSRTRLREVEDESSKRAGRLRAVSAIASFVPGPDDDRTDTILGIATAAMRPGMAMFGTLSHLDGDTIVFDATSSRGAGSAIESYAARIHAGARFPRERMLQDLLYNGGRTMAWDDVSVIAGRGQLLEDVPLRSFIGTPLAIGRRTYFLTFGSPVPMLDQPFEHDDLAYVDVVASFFASDFTQQQQFERIQFQIEHDALTGLENRVQFRKAVRDEIRAGRAFTLAFIDLDEFRRINERHGHQIGDEVLVEVAAALRSVCCDDFIARMSADEYGVLLRNARGPDTVEADIGRYADLFLVPFHTGDRDGTQVLTIGASLGAACFPQDGSTAEDLMSKADAALKVAKTLGGSSALFFDAPMGAMLEESHLRMVEFSAAIAEDQLALDYQPTVELTTREISGAEALVRWDHPDRGRLGPAEFIDFAERHGLIGSLTHWVLRRVVRDITAAPGLPPGFRVYVNVSAQMLNDVPFITALNDAIRSHADLVDHLGVEVTETAAMENIERSMHTIDLFRRWGLTVAIDDFGTGYSSLAYLKELQVDVVKIDRSFICGLPGDDRDTVITEMLLRITERFGFATLAEGIETEEQAAWLLEHGCRYGQGFLFARPAPFAALLQRLTALATP